jgi:oxygen-independent coproporphyrinogen-3 oxidase
LGAAGFDWYEVSNWARSAAQACRHNLGYWRGDDWWGIGPGAHSYLGPRPDAPARRWWNVKHPRAYAARLAEGSSPEAEHEDLTAEQVAVEDVMLRVRLAEGLSVATLSDDGRTQVGALAADGLVDPDQAACGTIILTRRGRLLADAVVRAVTD